MAWIIGLASDAEIARILRAGYEVHTTNIMPAISEFTSSEHTGDRGIAVFVDCDVHELLNLTEED